jgi:hypothetical protein
MVRITVHREALPHVIVTSLAARTPVQCFSWNVEDCRGVVTLQVRTPQDSTRAWFVSESRLAIASRGATFSGRHVRCLIETIGLADQQATRTVGGRWSQKQPRQFLWYLFLISESNLLPLSTT